jgi:HK97 family phage major capsid protein
MDKEVLQEAQEALAHVRHIKEKFDNGVVTEAEFKNAMEKTNIALDKQEKANQEFLAKKEEEAKALEEIKERADKLEKHLLEIGSGRSTEMRATAEYKAFNSFLKSGDAKELDLLTKEINRTDIPSAGGVLVPQLMFNEIVKGITEISPIRRFARVVSIGGKSIDLPTRASLLTSAYEGETEESETSNSTYGLESFTPTAHTVMVPVTLDQLMNSAFNFENEIISDVVEAFAQKEGNLFVNGDGVKKPEGILVNAAVVAGARTSASSGAINIDDLILLAGDLKSGYNGKYSFNRATNAYLRTLKDSNGQYLWQMPGGNTANTINGFEYIIDNEMPNIAAGTIPVLFADFAKGYRIVDRTAMSTIRDDYTAKKFRIVEFQFTRWNTGKVQLAEAIKALKVQA